MAAERLVGTWNVNSVRVRLEHLLRVLVEWRPDVLCLQETKVADEQFPLAFFYLNEALFQQQKPLEQSFFFDDQALHSLPSWVQTRYLRMEAESAQRSGAFAAAAGFLLLEMQGRTTLHQTRQGEVIDLLERLRAPAELAVFYERHPGIDWLEARRPFVEARVLFNAGETARTLVALEQLQVAPGIVVAAFSIIFGGIVLALAISFRVGGIEAARKMIEQEAREKKDVKRDIEHI